MQQTDDILAQIRAIDPTSLDQQITLLERDLATLKALRKLAGPDGAAKPAVGRKCHARATTKDAIVTYLRSHGATPARKLADAIGKSYQTAWTALKSDVATFKLTSEGWSLK